MIYKVNQQATNSTDLTHHVKQTLTWGAIAGMIVVICMYALLLKAETEIRLEGTNLTNEPERVLTRYDNK